MSRLICLIISALWTCEKKEWSVEVYTGTLFAKWVFDKTIIWAGDTEFLLWADLTGEY